MPTKLWRVAQRKIALILAATTIEALRAPPSNHLEKLSGDRKGQHSIKINDQYRVCFRWNPRAAEATQIEIVDYH